jgi:chemotaxis family two-component system sensor kinase Cph1
MNDRTSSHETAIPCVMGLSGPHPAGDRDACEREPIHIPGAIQPHGVLLSADPENWTIAQVSANSAKLLGQPPEALAGRPLSHLLGPDTMAELASRDLSPVFPHLYDQIPVFIQTSPERSLCCIAHEHDGRVILEFEEPSGTPPSHAEDLHRRLVLQPGFLF